MCSCDQSLVIVALLWQKLSQPQFYKNLTRKTAFFEEWSWFKFNNLVLVLGTSLKFYTSMAKGLKLKVRKFLGLIPTFVEVTGEKLVEGALLPSPLPPSWIGLKSITIKQGSMGFIICKSYITPTFFILHTFRWCMFYPLTLFTQPVFKMVLFEMIQTYPSGHAICTNCQYEFYMALLKGN